jgi:hypothetical protein
MSHIATAMGNQCFVLATSVKQGVGEDGEAVRRFRLRFSLDGLGAGLEDWWVGEFGR